MQGKIISIIKSLRQDGSHESFFNKGSKVTNFVFVANIENVGDCTFFSVYAEPKWKPGMIVEYEDSGTTDIRGNKKIRIKAEVGEAKKSSSSSYNDPVNNKRMAMGMAHTCALITINSLEERGVKIPYSKDTVEESVKVIFGISHKYYKWITKEETISDRDVLSRRWYAIEFGAKCIGLKEFSMKGTATDTVIAIAEMQFADTMNIKGPSNDSV